ncbi:unnamed protein product, partial [Cuscuta epithymum]
MAVMGGGSGDGGGGACDAGDGGGCTNASAPEMVVVLVALEMTIVLYELGMCRWLELETVLIIKKEINFNFSLREQFQEIVNDKAFNKSQAKSSSWRSPIFDTIDDETVVGEIG